MLSWQSGGSADGPTLLGELHELIEACVQQGRAFERVDHVHAGKAYAAALSALERVLLRVDPARVDEARALLVAARRKPHL